MTGCAVDLIKVENGVNLNTRKKLFPDSYYEVYIHPNNQNSCLLKNPCVSCAHNYLIRALNDNSPF